jgi:hypothetical protein
MSLCIGILGCSNFGFRDAFASLNNADNTTLDTPKSQDKIFGNTSTNGNPMGFPNIKNDIYYQVNIDNILNPISISTVGVRISNILYDNDQKSITLVITPGQGKSDSVVIDLPRRIIDSRIDDTDKNFTVLINNQPAKYQEIVNKNKSNISSEEYPVDNKTRKLVIEFGKDAKVIKIIGTELSNITSQDQSGLSISKPGDIQDGNQNPYFLISVVSFIFGIIFTIVYFLYRKRKFHIRK